MSIKEQIQNDMKSALKSGDKLTLRVIRYLLSQLKNAEIKKGRELKEPEVLGVISKQVKKTEEAAEEFREGGSSQRAEEELKEAEILKKYLPEPLTEEEIDAIIERAIKEKGASSMKDMGPVMKAVIPQIKGRADGKLVSEKVKEKLSG